MRILGFKFAIEKSCKNELKFFPSSWMNTFKYWIKNIEPWCISRQIWWGHRIPVWYSDKNTKVAAENIDEAKTSPLAQKLFHFPFIKEIFINSNYISITKYEINSWDEVVMEIREFVRSFLEEGNTVIEESKELKSDVKNASGLKNLNALEKQIISILKEYIQPAVASDGGNIEFDSYDSNEKSVRVILQGACSGCPSSTLTLKNGIETMLKEMMPGKIENVVALNG